MAKKAGFPDQTPGAGILEALITGAMGLGSTYLQAFDQLYGGNPIYLKSVSASVTPPTMTGTVPGWQPITRRIDDGKFWVIDHLGLHCAVADESYARISRRYQLAGNVATASPSAPAAPTVAAQTHAVGIDEANGSNTFSYKFAWVNLLNQESALSAASSTLTPTAAQKRIDVTIPALATGATVARIYRTRPGQGATGPWYWIDDAPAGAFRDVHPDADLDLTTQHPGVTWGNAFVGETATGVSEMIYVCTNALSAAPNTIVYTNQRGKRGSAAFAPGTAATQLRIAPDGEGRQWAALSAIATHPVQPPRIADYGVTQVIGFNNSFAAMAGQWVIYGMQVLMETEFTGAIPIAGHRVMQRLSRPVVIPEGAVFVAEAGGQAAQAVGLRELHIMGREYDMPT